MTWPNRTSDYNHLLNALRQQALIGVYRVRLDSIQVSEVPENRVRNVERLKQIFRTQQCLRHDPNNYIAATINGETLQRYTSTTQSSDGVTELLLRAEDRVLCLHGQCRILAAQDVLRGPDRWWLVALYNEDLDGRCKDYLGDAYANQQGPSDGTIYVNLQKATASNDAARIDQWKAYLSKDKRRYLRQTFNKHDIVTSAFDRLLPMEFLFYARKAFRIGVFHKMVALHLDERLVNYINDVLAFWSQISNHGAHAVSVIFVETIQGRCPRHSRQDHRHLQQCLTTTGALGHLSQQAKEHIYQNVILYRRTIPSLFTFFEDLKYIERCCEVLTGLLDDHEKPDQCSLESCFQELFRTTSNLVIQTGHDTFESRSLDGRDHFQLAYLQLWLSAMRLWPFLLVRRGRKCFTISDERFSSADRSVYWGVMARTARKLGFDSAWLRSLSACSSEVLLEGSPRYTGFVDGKDGKWERYGVPFDDKYLLDRNSLFLPQLMVDWDGLEGVGDGEDVTTLWARRSLFLRLFPESQSVSTAPEASHDRFPVQDRLPLQDHPTEEPEPIARSKDSHGSIVSSSRPQQPVSPRVDAEDLSRPRRETPSHSRNDLQADAQYRIDVWSNQRTCVVRTRGTREAWIEDLQGWLTHNFQLFDYDTLGGVTWENLSGYPKNHIVAMWPGGDVATLRRIRGL